MGAAIVVTGIPIGASGGRVEHEALRADALVLPIDYSTSILAETANEADLLLADDVAQLDGYRGAHFGGWRELDGPVGRWLADGAPPRPRGQVVVANLGVGAARRRLRQRGARARRARGDRRPRHSVSARRAASRSSGSALSA